MTAADAFFERAVATRSLMAVSNIFNSDSAAPFTHDLGELANELKIVWQTQELEDLDEITDLAILIASITACISLCSHL